LVSPKVKECLAKASESRRNAIQTRDPQRREFWREIGRINIAPTTGFLNQNCAAIYTPEIGFRQHRPKVNLLRP
jgi:hypothetical protein